MKTSEEWKQLNKGLINLKNCQHEFQYSQAQGNAAWKDWFKCFIHADDFCIRFNPPDLETSLPIAERRDSRSTQRGPAVVKGPLSWVKERVEEAVSNNNDMANNNPMN